MEKYNAAATAGWRVFKCTPKDVHTLATIGMIRQALAGGANA
jgi:hypothetical protein